MQIECHYTSCRVKFNAQKNRKYHSRECALQSRREKDRLRKRKWRLEQYDRRIKEQVKKPASSKTERLSAVCVRILDHEKKFFYRCDTCGGPVFRPARMLHVYCSEKCRLSYLNKQRRIRRYRSSGLKKKARRRSFLKKSQEVEKKIVVTS